MPPFQLISEKPLFYAGVLPPTPERNHYLVCAEIDKNELYHLRYRASLSMAQAPRSFYRIHFYSYLLPDLEQRETILFFREEFALRPYISARYLAERTTKWLASQIQAVSGGEVPPAKAASRTLLLPGKPAARHWLAVARHFIDREVGK